MTGQRTLAVKKRIYTAPHLCLDVFVFLYSFTDYTDFSRKRLGKSVKICAICG